MCVPAHRDREELDSDIQIQQARIFLQCVYGCVRVCYMWKFAGSRGREDSGPQLRQLSHQGQGHSQGFVTPSFPTWQRTDGGDHSHWEGICFFLFFLIDLFFFMLSVQIKPGDRQMWSEGNPTGFWWESYRYLHNSTLGLEAQSKSTSDYIYFFFAISPSVSRLAHPLLIGRNVFKVVVFLSPISIIKL